MDNKIEKSVIAKGGSTVSGVNIQSNNQNNLRKVKAEYTLFGFILGIISELIASYIYYIFFK